MNLIPKYRAFGGRPFPLWGAALAGFALLAFVSVSQGQITVTTIGGGVRKECGNSFGFSAGTTYTQSQFHTPTATALDSLGNLWVADMGNSDIEQVSAAGDKTSSFTIEYTSGSNLHPFPNVVGIAVDSANNLYVLTETTLYLYNNASGTFPSLDPQFELSLKNFATGTASAITVANDASTNIYISFTNGSGGTIIQIPQPYAGTPNTVVGNYAFAPAGLSIRSDGQLAVSDTRNNAIYVVPTAAGSTPLMVTGGHGAGLMNGSPAFAAFNQPRGIAASGDGRMVVCDTLNNCVRVIDTSFNTTTLYGTPSNVWTTTCCSCNPALYGGWVDGTPGNAATNASSREPLSVTISSSGTLFVTEGFYNLLRLVTDSGLTPVGPPSPPAAPGSSTNLPAVVTDNATAINASGATLNASVFPAGTATQVSFQWGLTTNYTTNTAAFDVSTNLNGTNLVSIPLAGLPVNTLIHFEAVAINGAGQTTGGDRTFITGTAASINNQLGFTNNPSIGVGATAYLPIALELQSGSTATSLQFRVEVTPNAGTTPQVSSLSLLPITTNDFIPLIGPAPGNVPIDLSVIPYPSPTVPYTTVSNNGQGLFVFASPESGMNIQNFGVVGLLSFQIPFNASPGQTYNLSVLFPSGTAENITAMGGMLTVTNVPYLAGDSSPATGYDAGEFGDGVLDNDDVVNAIFASMGVRVPPLYSDAFNAMDVYPQTPTENGDGLIQFQDWNTILLRSVGLESPNWIRYWTNLGVLFGQTTTNGLPGDAFVAATAPARLAVRPPGMVWQCQAAIGADSVANLVPGNTCSLPVYVKVRPGSSLSGFQFRAIVSADGNAPPVGQVQFNPANGIPSPMLSGTGLSPNDVLVAWEVGAFSPPLENSNYIGVISFQIPSTAKAGQSYVVHFTGVDGAPDNTTAYTLESFPGFAWVLTGPQQPASVTSDEWKLHFFGSLTSSLAGDTVDADGDGAPNWQEYLAGTDPANPLSVLKIGGKGYATNGAGGIALSWLTAPGKTYILESASTPGGKSWTAINTNEGDGYIYQFNQNNYQGNAKFFRILLQP
jgi:hypothetical protein